MRVLKAGEGEVLDLAFSPDGRAVAAAVHYQGVFLWNLEAATPVPVRLSAEGGYSRGGLQFSADGRSVAWRSAGGRRVYYRDTREYADHSFAVTALTHGVVASADGSRVVSRHGIPDHCLIGWRAVPGWAREWVVSTADLAVDSLTLSADGRRFAMLTRVTFGNRWSVNPMRVEVRDAATAAVHATGEYPYSYAYPLLFSPDARQLVGLNNLTLLVWPVPDGGTLAGPQLVRNDTRKHFTAMAFHPSGRQLFATSNDTTVHVFDAHSWTRAGRFTWQLGRLKAITVSPDGTLAAAGGDKGDVVIWDVD